MYCILRAKYIAGNLPQGGISLFGGFASKSSSERCVCNLSQVCTSFLFLIGRKLRDLGRHFIVEISQQQLLFVDADWLRTVNISQILEMKHRLQHSTIG